MNCTAPSCTNTLYCKGICEMHYSRLRKHGSLDLPPKRPPHKSGGNKNIGTAHNRFKHGMTGTTTYKSWQGMNRRCYRTAGPNYKNYGARGIKVCDRWHVFENFLADMGVCPTGMTIERKDNDKNYEPSNCCWASRTTQGRNRRSVRLSMDVAKAIREDRAKGLTFVALAGKYSISPSHAKRVADGESWSEDPSLIGRPARRAA